ncbi:hypothetical protein [Nocardia aurea]|uniref:Secreted protein n=1 Tax=Nocardia aurea TaxID=2144174 RepID=A0ABV3G1M5_9NOCA
MTIIRKTLQALTVCTAVGLAALLPTVPASADVDQVCNIELLLRIGADDVRDNTKIQVTLGDQSVLLDGGIPDRSTAFRTGSFQQCVSNSQLDGGFTITSISNPSWPETTDNWNLLGLVVRDPDTGRIYSHHPSTGALFHRFTGEDPTIHMPSFDPGNLPFFDSRYARCVDDQIFAKFVDPLAPDQPTFTVSMRPTGTLPGDPSVPGSFSGPPSNDWGGELDGLGIRVSRAAAVVIDASTPDNRRAAGVILAGCNPNGL